MKVCFATLRLFLPFLFLPILLAGCTRQPPVAKVPPVEVIIAQPVQDGVSEWDSYTGLAEAGETVELRARVQGEIKEDYLKSKELEGKEVKGGELLYQIDDQPYKAELEQAKGQVQTWEAKLQAAEEKIKIYKPLYEKNQVAKEEWVKVVGDKGEAVGSLETAKGKVLQTELNIKYCKITAPIGGRLSQSLQTKGNLVNATAGGTMLTTLVSVDPMYVSFYVNERALLNYKQMKINEKANKKPNGINPGKNSNGDSSGNIPPIPVKMALATSKGYPFEGIIDFADNKVDPGTGSIKVRAKFENPQQADGSRLLTPGLFARVQVEVSEKKKEILIADRAILTDQNILYVLVVNKDKNNLVERVDIEAGRLQPDGLRVIKSGLNGNEWIVTEGLTQVRAGVTVQPSEGKMPRQLPKQK